MYDFHGHLNNVIDRAKGEGTIVKIMTPDECTPKQITHMRHIIEKRDARDGVVFSVKKVVLLAYDDPRFVNAISYLTWTKQGWATPKGKAAKLVKLLDQRNKKL